MTTSASAPPALGLMDFVRAAKAQVNEISPRVLQNKLIDESVLLVDVREPGEYQAGHIDGAHLVPRGVLEAAADLSFPQHVPELAQARERPVVVYCATGGRSAMAAAVLQQMGFKDVSSLDGGYGRWVADLASDEKVTSSAQRDGDVTSHAPGDEVKVTSSAQRE